MACHFWGQFITVMYIYIVPIQIDWISGCSLLDVRFNENIYEYFVSIILQCDVLHNLRRGRMAAMQSDWCRAYL